MSRPEGTRPRAGVLSAVLAAPGRGEKAVLSGFVPPRGAFLATIERQDALAGIVEKEGAPGALLVLDAWRGGRLAYDPEPVRASLPSFEVVTVDPEALLNFLWHYLDRHDPLALGHARPRALFPPGVLERGCPSPRRASKRSDRRRAAEMVRSMLGVLGLSLGIRPPLPPPSVMSHRRIAALLESCAGLYAGLLHRWGAPIAVRHSPADGPELLLADRCTPARSTDIGRFEDSTDG